MVEGCSEWIIAIDLTSISSPFFEVQLSLITSFCFSFYFGNRVTLNWTNQGHPSSAIEANIYLQFSLPVRANVKIDTKNNAFVKSSYFPQNHDLIT